MAANCNSRGLQSAQSKRTPVTCGCPAPPSHGSSNRNPRRLRPAQRPPTPKRSQIHRRQPAQTPLVRAALGAERPPTPQRTPFRRRCQPRRRQGAPPSVQDARRRRSDLKSTAANQPRRRQPAQPAASPCARFAPPRVQRPTGRSRHRPRSAVDAHRSGARQQALRALGDDAREQRRGCGEEEVPEAGQGGWKEHWSPT